MPTYPLGADVQPAHEDQTKSTSTGTFSDPNGARPSVRPFLAFWPQVGADVGAVLGRAEVVEAGQDAVHQLADRCVIDVLGS